MQVADVDTGETVECTIDFNQHAPECGSTSPRLVFDVQRSVAGPLEMHGFHWPDRTPRSASIRIEHTDVILVQATVEPNYSEHEICGDMCFHGLAILQRQAP